MLLNIFVETMEVGIADAYMQLWYKVHILITTAWKKLSQITYRVKTLALFLTNSDSLL